MLYLVDNGDIIQAVDKKVQITWCYVQQVHDIVVLLVAEKHIYYTL